MRTSWVVSSILLHALAELLFVSKLHPVDFDVRIALARCVLFEHRVWADEEVEARLIALRMVAQ